MRRRTLVVVAWVLVGAELWVVANEVPHLSQTAEKVWEVFFTDTIFTLAGILFAAVGAFIVTRHPRNLIAWLMMAPGLLAFEALAKLPPPPSPGFLEYVGIYFSSVSWVLIVFPVALLIALFPTGRPVSIRWRWQTWLATGMPGFFLIFVAFATYWSDNEIETPWSIRNPIGFITVDPFENEIFTTIWTAALAAVVAGAAVAMVVRYRRARYEERQQIKWLLFAVAMFATGFVSEALVGESSTNEALSRLLGVGFSVGLMFIPIAIAIALLKYKAFDIDLVIRRTLSYTAVTIVLVAVYLGSVIASQTLLESAFGFASTIGIAISTLIVAALFNPLRRRIQGWVDRRFNRSRYDIDQVLAEFADRLKDRVDINQIRIDLTGVISQTLHPSAIGMWVFEPVATVRERTI